MLMNCVDPLEAGTSWLVQSLSFSSTTVPCRGRWFEVFRYKVFCSGVTKNMNSDSHCRCCHQLDEFEI